MNLKPGLNLPDKEDDLTCLVGLRTAWILRGQWGSRLPGEGPEPGKSMGYKWVRTPTWLRSLCRGKQSLILKSFLIPNLLGQMGDS